MAKSLVAGKSYLGQRLDFLRGSQNADGGWGYFPGKASWLEPTVYAAMALHGESAADRAWQLLQTWQIPNSQILNGQDGNGGWRSSAVMTEPGWGTALCVSLALGRGQFDANLQRGVDWLLQSVGAETNWISIVVGFIKRERDFRLKAWPWKPGDSGWVEPTAHALVALKQVALKQARLKARKPELTERITSGEAQLLEVRSGDGGWNYGSAAALGVPLPSYPETTALALVGLQGKGGLEKAFELAARQLQETPSPLARAWLTIALRLHGLPLNANTLPGEEHALTAKNDADVMITALEALAAPEGNHWFMKANTL